MCANLGADVRPGGVRIFDGAWSDAYLGRWPVRAGYTYVIWKGRHVGEPTALTTEELTGFWGDVMHVARVIEDRYQPRKLNYLILGNSVPHLHVHLVPRHDDDPSAGGPLEADAFEKARESPMPEDELRAEASALRSELERS